MRVEEGGSRRCAFRPVGLKQEFLYHAIGVLSCRALLTFAV